MVTILLKLLVTIIAIPVFYIPGAVIVNRMELKDTLHTKSNAENVLISLLFSCMFYIVLALIVGGCIKYFNWLIN